MARAPLEVQIWSDIACPWCYLGKRRFEAALGQVPFRDQVNVTWRAFELDPGAPAVYPPSPSYAQRLANKYRLSLSRAEQMLEEMTERGRKEDVVFDYGKIVGGNTLLGHQLMKVAQAEDLPAAAQQTLVDRVFRAYFSEGKQMSDAETLAQLGASVGLDTEKTRHQLLDGAFEAAARADEEQARKLGITGVPFFVIGRYGISGAQPAELLAQVLNRAWSEQAEDDTTAQQSGDGQACSVDGCEPGA